MELTVTDRTTFLAALAAAAVLAFPASQARADPAAPEAETSAGESQTTATATPVEDDPKSTDPIAAESVFSGSVDDAEHSAAPERPAETEATAETRDEAAPGAAETPLPSASDAPSPPAEASDDSPSEGSGPVAEAGSTVSVLVSAGETSHGTGAAALPSTPTASPAKPGAHPPAASAPKGAQHTGGGLKELLPHLDRELGAVQSEIDELRRGLADGVVPPVRRLRHLRSSLDDLEPALLALSTQLHGADQLSPHLRRLLTRVRTRLSTVRASAADLSLAIRSSGLSGPELRRLLQELERFGELSVSLGGLPAAGTRAAVIPAAATTPPLAPLAGARAPAAPPAAAPPRAHPAGGPRIGAPQRGDPDPAPRSSAPGSATAAPAGAFAAAGLALLVLLLVRPSLSRLRERLDLPSCRGYAVAFLTPLERPG